MGVWSTNFQKLLTPMPDLMSLASAEAHIIIGLRVAVMSQKAYRDARPFLRERLGSDLAVSRFLVLVETIGGAWPESVKIGRACCPHTMPDEILLLNMLRHAAVGNRPGFDALTCEMIGDSARERIYMDMESFAAVYGKRTAGKR
ncbi:hypothetical protein AB1K62_07375 [Parasphingorhabdus sp. JC815]|uniref:hypothetical protein n=1 Tax=Parasphingorhabdus sp. JC815 TaxID=3232140 RepID=UPI003458362C